MKYILNVVSTEWGNIRVHGTYHYLGVEGWNCVSFCLIEPEEWLCQGEGSTVKSSPAPYWPLLQDTQLILSARTIHRWELHFIYYNSGNVWHHLHWCRCNRQTYSTTPNCTGSTKTIVIKSFVMYILVVTSTFRLFHFDIQILQNFAALGLGAFQSPNPLPTPPRGWCYLGENMVFHHWFIPQPWPSNIWCLSDTCVIYQSVLEKKTYKWLICDS